MSISIAISIFALITSFFVTYQNYLKPFKLFLKNVRNIFWVYTDGTVRLDLVLFFLNRGMKHGFIDSIEIEWGDGKQFYPELLTPT